MFHRRGSAEGRSATRDEKFLTFCPLVPDRSSPCLNSCMTRSTVSFCGSDSRGLICHLHSKCLGLIKRGSDKAVPEAADSNAASSRDVRFGTDVVCALEGHALSAPLRSQMTRRRARADFLQQGDFRHKFGAAELESCRRAVRAEIALDRLAVAAESIPKGNPGLACAQDFELARFGEWVKLPRPCNEHLST